MERVQSVKISIVRKIAGDGIYNAQFVRAAVRFSVQHISIPTSAIHADRKGPTLYSLYTGGQLLLQGGVLNG